MGVYPRCAPAPASRALSGSRLTDATVTSFRVLSSVWRPKFRPGWIATRRYRGLRARTRIAFAPHRRDPRVPHRKIPRLTPRPFSVLAPRRHVVLPPDIAKLLPKGRLLSEVGYRSPRSGRDPPRPSFSDGGCELEIQRFPSRCTRATFGCERWFFKAFPPPDSPPPRALHSSSRARSLTIRSPFVHQAEWRGLGVQQSRGWVHYAIHRPEPHIMLYRCVRRPCPHAAVGFREFRARVFQTDRGDARPPRRSHRARRSHRPRDDLVASPGSSRRSAPRETRRVPRASPDDAIDTFSHRH